MTDSRINAVYAILDAARIFGELETAQKLQSKFLNLYKGSSEELLSSVAPYLFHYQPGSEFSVWLLDKGWGNAWGVFVISDASLDDLQKHLRKFLMVKTDDGKELYFRFYDPRVLRHFLPTCDAMQLRDFFGPVKIFAMESEDPEYAIEILFESGQLITRKVVKQEFWNRLNGSRENIGSGTDSQATVVKTDGNEKKPGKKWNFLVD